MGINNQLYPKTHNIIQLYSHSILELNGRSGVNFIAGKFLGKHRFLESA